MAESGNHKVFEKIKEKKYDALFRDYAILRLEMEAFLRF